MAVTLKTDSEDLPSILAMFGLGGLPKEAAAEPEASPDKRSDSGVVPIKNPPSKLQLLQHTLSGGSHEDAAAAVSPNPSAVTAAAQGDTSGFVPRAVSAPGPIVSRGAEGIPPVFSEAPEVAKPTFATAHPKLAETFSILSTLAGGAAAGAGKRTFGEGYTAAQELPLQLEAQRQGILRNTLENTLAQAQVNELPLNQRIKTAEAMKTEAEARRLSEPDKPVVNYNQGIPVTITRGTQQYVIGSPDMPPELKPIADAAIAAHKQRVTESKDKPDTAQQDKERGRALENQLRAGTINDADRQELVGRQLEAKLNGVPSEVVAQVGKPPVPAQYAKGENDAAYKTANAAWGKAVEAIKLREASASGAARGEGFGAGRRIAVVDPRDGQVKIMSAGAAENLGAAPASEGIKLMSKEAQFSELHVAAEKAKDAITGLDRDFTPTQIAKLTLAFSHNDESIVKNEVDAILGTQQLTPAQQDFVIWLNQLNERAMSLRNIAGMGQGSQDLRSAIRATLPGLKSGSKQMALKQLDAFNNQVSLLEKGVPKINRPAGSKPATTPANSKYPDFVPD